MDPESQLAAALQCIAQLEQRLVAARKNSSTSSKSPSSDIVKTKKPRSKDVCHASFSTIRKFLRDVVGIPVSRGYLAKLIAKMTD